MAAGRGRCRGGVQQRGAAGASGAFDDDQAAVTAGGVVEGELDGFQFGDPLDERRQLSVSRHGGTPDQSIRTTSGTTHRDAEDKNPSSGP